MSLNRLQLLRLMHAAALAIVSVAAGKGQESPVADAASPADLPLQRYHTRDRFGRQVAFYLDKRENPREAPLALFILGSGAYSQFLVRDGKTLYAQRDFYNVTQGRARMLMVERVGVEFGWQPERRGTAVGSPEEFRREHTLERWVEANSAALRAARTLAGIDQARTLVMGHSEGSLVAAAVAAENAFVTHVACLSGGAPTQLFDFLQEARLGKLTTEGPTPDAQVRSVWERWRDIQAHADDPNRMWMGHAYPRWATFMATSDLEELARSKAKVFVAQGSLDGVNPRYAVDLVQATLVAKGRDVTVLLVEGANHGLQFPNGTPGRDGWREIQEKVVAWFVEPR